MTFSDYFKANISTAVEVIVSMIIQSNWECVEELSELVSASEQPRFRMLLAALEELPLELQKRIADHVLALGSLGQRRR